MSAALTAVQDLFVAAQQNLSMMLVACRTKEEHDDVVARYQKLQENYYAAVDATFQENDRALQALIAQAEATAADLRGIATELGNIAKVLNVLGTAVHYGAQIVGMAA